MTTSVENDLQTSEESPLETNTSWTAPRTTSLDDQLPLEYDEHHIDLIADQEIDDDSDEFELDGKPMKSQISPDGIIDDDFESELGGCQITDFPQAAAEHEENNDDWMKKLANYEIVQYVGDDKFGRKILICSASSLPNETTIKQSEFINLDHFYNCLFEYILQTFDSYVNMDYVIIYFHHGLNSSNRPAYSWFMRAYRSIDRKYKKNLKALYIVQPTLWIKFLWPFLRSLISGKFAKKVNYIDHLDQLSEFVYLDQIPIPTAVKMAIPSRNRANFSVSLQELLQRESDQTIPMVMRETIDYLRNNSLQQIGLFCRTAPILLIKDVQMKYHHGQSVLFENYGDVHLPATILKMFLRNLSEPLLTYRLYPEFLGLSALKRHDQIDVIRDIIIEKLPQENYLVLKYLIEFLNLVSNYSDVNLMTTKQLSIAFGSILAWSDESSMNTLVNCTLINQLTEILIARYTELLNDVFFLMMNSDEIRSLPFYFIPKGWIVHFIDRRTHREELQHFEKLIDNGQLLAFDTETMPSFYRSSDESNSSVPVNRPALLQVAVRCAKSKDVFLFDLQDFFDQSRPCSNSSFIAHLIDCLFNHRHALKLSHSFFNDLGQLKCYFDEQCFHQSKIERFIELSKIYRQIYPQEKEQEIYSLQRMTAMTLHHQLDKKQRCANWSKRPLNQLLKDYAAMDVIVMIEIYDRLKTKFHQDFVDPQSTWDSFQRSFETSVDLNEILLYRCSCDQRFLSTKTRNKHLRICSQSQSSDPIDAPVSSLGRGYLPPALKRAYQSRYPHTFYDQVRSTSAFDRWNQLNENRPPDAQYFLHDDDTEVAQAFGFQSNEIPSSVSMPILLEQNHRKSTGKIAAFPPKAETNLLQRLEEDLDSETDFHCHLFGVGGRGRPIGPRF